MNRTYWIACGYKFGFQGQEAENELYGAGNASFFKYRISDNRLGRFFAIDPLAAEYPHNSPYAFSENRVIDGVELEGLEVNLLSEFDPAYKYGGNNIKVTNYIFVVAHATSDYIINGKDFSNIETSEEFDIVMHQNSSIWRERANSKEPVVVVLVACHSEEMAQNFSEAFPDVYFVAPQYGAYPNSNGSYSSYSSNKQDIEKDKSTPNNGTWYIYKGYGKPIDNTLDIQEKIGTYTGSIMPQYTDKSDNSNATKFELITNDYDNQDKKK